MKAFLISLTLLLVVCNMHLQAQNEVSREIIQDSLFRQIELFPQEKIHLHIDRDVYVPGEKIWFKAYVADAYTHRTPTYSRYVYVELIDSSDSLITRVMVRQENDMLYGHLFLSEMIPTGQYTVRAYTRYMGNMGDDYFFRKNILIKNLLDGEESEKIVRAGKKDDYDVSFFPEGGNLLEGVMCRVAFKALNKTGYSETIYGEVVDGNGNKIADVETLYAGMGTFVIGAEHGKQYYLECRNSKGTKKRFKIPEAYASAYSISTLWNFSGGELFVIRNRAVNSPDIPHYLLVHSKGFLLYFSKWDNSKEHIIFKKDQIPPGVIQLLLLDKDMNPLSERLVFNKTEEQIKMVFSTDKKVYERRDLVSATIQLSDFEGNYLAGNLSVAITDDKDVSIDSLTTIASSLLLSSELRGYIETPAYYLQDDRKASYALDNLMMIHGWRRYNIPEVMKGNMEIPEKAVEASKEISGVVKSFFLEKPVENAEVTLMSSAGDLMQTETNGKGEFMFAGLEMPDSSMIFVQSLNKKGKPNINLVANEETFPNLKHSYVSEPDDNMNHEHEDAGFVKKAEQRAKYDEDMRFVQLKEVSVTAKIPEKKDEARLRYWANASSDITIRREEIERRRIVRTENLLSSIPGILVIDGVVCFTRSMGLSVLVGSTPALIVLDGMVVEDIQMIGNTYDIESIDIFNGAGASIFGINGAGGVISITTRVGGSPSGRDKNPNFAILSPLGYQAPVEFYSPKYDTPNAKYLNNPDYRTTIFWKPDIVVNDNGKAHFSFYTSDFPSTYSVVIEGISNDGQIIRRVERIEVK